MLKTPVATRDRSSLYAWLARALGAGTAVACAVLLVLTVVGFDDEQHQVHDLGAGAFMGLILAVGLLASARAPERSVAGAQQALLGFLALAVALVASGVVDFRLGFVVFAALLVVLYPTRRELVRTGRGFSPLLAVLAVLGAVPLGWFASDQIDVQRLDLTGSLHWKQGHWAGMAAIAMAIPLVALLSSLKTPGWRVSAWSAGGASVVFGAASLVFPHEASSIATTWAALAVAGGSLFVGVAEWEARRAAARVSRGEEVGWPAEAT